MRKYLRALASLELTIILLAILMVLVVACTLAQVNLGIYGAVKAYIRSFVVWHGNIPIFPGGALAGLALLFNLTAAMFVRLEWSWRKAGLWLVHSGLILLFVGEFISGGFQVETQMAIDEGATKNYTEDTRRTELAIIEEGASEDTVYSIPQSRLAKGGLIEDARLPFSLKIVQYMPNSTLDQAPFLAAKSPATAGAGTMVAAFNAPLATSDDERDVPSAYAEFLKGGKSLGTYLVSLGLSPQAVEVDGKRYILTVRSRRTYLPYSLTLKDFRHDVYPGTDIPKNFSSLVRLKDPERNEDRDVLIYMNAPLRYRGQTFYQASFGKGDTLSVLQVVQNPGWTIPYLACVLVSLGLAWHFLARMNPFRRPS